MIEEKSTAPDRIVSAKERRRMVPYSDVHIGRLEKAGKFPKRIPLGAGRVGWSLQELIDWIEAKKAKREAPVQADERLASHLDESQEASDSQEERQPVRVGLDHHARRSTAPSRS